MTSKKSTETKSSDFPANIVKSRLGHVMKVVKNGLTSGDEIANEFSSNHSNTKVFFAVDSKPGTV